MNQDLKEIIITEKQLSTRIAEIGQLISKKYKNKELVLIGLLKGAYVFTADIARNIDNPHLNVEFIVVSSYLNGKSTSEVKIVLDLKTSIANKHVVIIEDIIDTGRTLSKVKNIFENKGAQSVEIAALCTKPSRREMNVKLDYPSFTIPNEIVVGYGLDYNEKYRHLPYIASITKKFKNKNLK